MIPAAIDTKLAKELDDFSPPPSPPPVHSLYTDGSIYRRTYASPTPLPTRNNKASVKTSLHNPVWYEKRPPLLVPKPSDLPSTDNEPVKLTRRQRVYGYMRSLTIYLLKQLLKKNNLALVINLIHQAWRARFFVARTIRIAHKTMATLPTTEEYAYYRDSLIQAGRLILMLVKAERRQLLMKNALKSNSQQLPPYQKIKQQLGSVDLRQTIELGYLYLTMILARATDVSKFGLKTGIRAIKHLGGWDSLAMAITSVALTRSLQNPTHWM